MIRYFIWNSSLSGWDIYNRYIYEFGEYNQLVLEEEHGWNSTKKQHFKDSSARISTSDLPPGIYLLKLSSESFYHVQKIIKGH